MSVMPPDLSWQPEEPSPACARIIQAALTRVPPQLAGVYFPPWVGTHYGQSTSEGPRPKIWLLGSSHYEWEAPAAQRGLQRPPGLTCWNIAAQLTATSHRFYTNIECTLLGRKPTPAEREAVWSSVVFSNFVQQIVGYGPTARPTPQMWATGHTAFRSLLAALQPDVVLVYGFELWEHLPGGYTALQDIREGTITLQRRAYGHTIACRVMHPSSPRFASRAWHPVVHRAMEETAGRSLRTS
jgi:hypothetical protein